jgi:hypothetical protein
MANLKAEPVQFVAERCGAKTRGERGGRPCRAWPMPNGRCRMHGGKSGGPTGSRNGAYRHGKYSQAGRELVRGLREAAKIGEAMLASSLDAVGLGRKIPPSLRRRAHIKKARAAAKKAKEGKA